MERLTTLARCDRRGAARSLLIAWIALLAAAPNAHAQVNLVPVILSTTGSPTTTLSISTGQSITTLEVEDGCALSAHPLTGAGLSNSDRTLIRFGARTWNQGFSDLLIGSPGCNCTTDFTCNPGFECSTAHAHQHYFDWLAAELFDPAGRLFSVGTKYSFCVIDLGGGAGCNNFLNCNNMGISSGCYDEYSSATACQYVDLTGYQTAGLSSKIPAGTYSLEMSTDPVNKIWESNESDNVDEATVSVACSAVNQACLDTNRCTYGEKCNASLVCAGGGCGPGMSCGSGGGNNPCKVASDLAAASWGIGRVDVVWRGNGNAIWHMWYDSSAAAWLGPENLGGNAKATPAIVARASGKLDVFWRGNDDQLYQRSYDNTTGTWTAAAARGGNMRGDPVATSWSSNRIDVMYEGTNENLAHVFWNGTSWSAHSILTAGIDSDLGAASSGINRVDVAWRNTNGNFVHKFYNGSSWSSNTSYTANMVSGPSLVKRATGVIDAVWRNGGDTLIWKSYNGSWSSNTNLGGSMGSKPSVISWSSTYLDAYWMGADGDLEENWTSNGGANWVGSTDVDGALIDRPVAVTWGIGHVDVFWVNAAGFVENVRWIAGRWSPVRELF